MAKVFQFHGDSCCLQSAQKTANDSKADERIVRKAVHFKLGSFELVSN